MLQVVIACNLVVQAAAAAHSVAGRCLVQRIRKASGLVSRILSVARNCESVLALPPETQCLCLFASGSHSFVESAKVSQQ